MTKEEFENQMKIQNGMIIEKLNSNEPFMFIKPSLSPVFVFLRHLIQHKFINFDKLYQLHSSSGIYFQSSSIILDRNDLKNLAEFTNASRFVIKNSQLCVKYVQVAALAPFYKDMRGKYQIYLDTFRPTYSGKVQPWVKELSKKKILIITETPDKIHEVLNKAKLIKDKPDRHPYIDILNNTHWIVHNKFINTYKTKPHESWKQTFDVMCEGLDKVDFDVALVSAGGYNFPFIEYIYKTLGKSAIQIGSSLNNWFIKIDGILK